MSDALHAISSRDQMARLVAAEVADVLEDAVDRHGDAVLIGAGGRTPLGVYHALARTPISWRSVRVTLTDERWADPRSPDSNERMIRCALLHDAAAAARFLPLKSDAASLEEGADRVDRALQALRRPADVVLLGMGEDGHVASLFPGSPVLAEGLEPEGARHCVAVPAGAPLPVLPRMSLTMSALAGAGRMLLLFTGAAKRRTYERALEGGDPRELPVRAVLRNARRLRVVWAP
ncbi:MAG: 6-phosphogluconolactonase [Pseudomonadota bacterium]